MNVRILVYVCPFCGRDFKLLGSLLLHVKTKHISGQYCPACGKRSKRLQNHAIRKARKDVKHAVIYLALARSRHVPSPGSPRYKIRKMLRRTRRLVVCRMGDS